MIGTGAESGLGLALASIGLGGWIRRTHWKLGVEAGIVDFEHDLRVELGLR